MVHKTTYHGVYSGNTLRAYNTRYSRRYHKQACIVSRIRPELLQKLVGEKADDKKSIPRNFAVNVALSLNKQSRWLLPSALIRQIENDDIAQPGLTVSLLQRHKLKNFANCVSFHSNRGKEKRIQPRKGRYCSFNFPTAGGKSRRALVRERREERKKKKVGEVRGRVVEVFTEQGIAASEVRYEVFYPSPASSSISHNPKYIKQDVPGDKDALPDNGQYVQHGKPRRQHRGKRRKRMSLKDIEDFDLPSYYNQGLPTGFDDTDDEDEEPPAIAEDTMEEKNTECFLSSLIKKAERLQQRVGLTKSRRRKKSGSSSKSFDQFEDDKSHIVYLSKSEPEGEDEDVSHSHSVPSMPVAPPMHSETTRVHLPGEDVTVTSLKDCFGQNYFEADCTPRKFVLDITANVREQLKKRRAHNQLKDSMADALSYLVCVHDGLYDDDFTIYRVLLNSRLHQGLLAVKINTESQQDVPRMTLMNLISQTIDFVDGLITDILERNRQPVHHVCSSHVPERQLKCHLGSAETYVPSVQHMFRTGSKVSNVTLPSLSDLLKEEPSFCEVCYDDVSPLSLDSAVSTSLVRCGHRVCDSCWSQHIHSRLHQGFVRVTCPGFNCQEGVKVGVLLSVAPLDSVEKVLQRQEEVRIAASHGEKWCPNKACGRVIHLHTPSDCEESHLQQDVVCACGAHVCFHCMHPAHWPASCKQAEEYRNNPATFPDRSAEVHVDGANAFRDDEGKEVMRVEGKICPSCKSFVLKNGGCNQMTCKCGQYFCWICAQPGPAHYDRSCLNTTDVNKMVTTILVRHLEADKSAEEREKRQKSKKRGRVSLMEKAADHHKHHSYLKRHCQNRVITSLAKAVATAAAKDKTLTQHITSICSGTSDIASANMNTSSSSGRTSSIAEMVSAFLKNAYQSKQELHEVVEYSLVFLNNHPDSLLRSRALRICEDLGAFCSFTQSVFDSWKWNSDKDPGHLQDAMKAITRLAEILGWVHSAIATHVLTIRKLRQEAEKH